MVAIVVITIIAITVFVYMVENAPLGWQDDTHFHFGVPCYFPLTFRTEPDFDLFDKIDDSEVPSHIGLSLEEWSRICLLSTSVPN